MTIPKPPKKRAAKLEMEARRVRIFAWLQSGMPMDDIAQMENVSRDRLRRIVTETLSDRNADRSVDRRLLNEVRLEPALRLAAKAVVEGQLGGIDRLVKVIDRLDQLARAAPKPVYDENARAKLMAKINLNLRRIDDDAAKGGAAPGPSVSG